MWAHRRPQFVETLLLYRICLGLFRLLYRLRLLRTGAFLRKACSIVGMPPGFGEFLPPAWPHRFYTALLHLACFDGAVTWAVRILVGVFVMAPERDFAKRLGAPYVILVFVGVVASLAIVTPENH